MAAIAVVYMALHCLRFRVSTWKKVHCLASTLHCIIFTLPLQQFEKGALRVTPVSVVQGALGHIGPGLSGHPSSPFKLKCSAYTWDPLLCQWHPASRLDVAEGTLDRM